MLFTVAIPAYNNEKTIGAAIESSIDQDYNGEYEILIVDGASTDETLQVVNSFKDPRIRVITNEKRCTLFPNHNNCINEAKGEYIIFCHADDKLSRQCLSILAARLAFRNYPQKYIVWGRSLFRDFYGRLKTINHPLNTILTGGDAVKCFLTVAGLTPSGTCYSRKSILQMGAFTSTEKFVMELDWYITIKAALNGFEFEMLDRLLIYRTYASTATCTRKKEWYKHHTDAFEVLMKNISTEEKEIYLHNYNREIHWQGYPYLKKILGKNQIKKTNRYFLYLIFARPFEIPKILQIRFMKAGS